MDIYDYLKKDHEKVAQFFELFEKTDDSDYQMEIFANIYKELFLHANAEQATFYKVLEAHPESHDIVKHSAKEHNEIEAKLLQIAKLKSANASFVKHVLELKKIVEHHVDEEENNLFSKAKEILSDDDAWMIKEKMHDMKDKLLQQLEKTISKETV